ncbi:MAG: hypothetical protein ABL993_01010 [Vicinamibacterales bacterium]
MAAKKTVPAKKAAAKPAAKSAPAKKSASEKAAPAPAKTEESAGRSRGPRGVGEDAVIHLLVDDNPKRVGSASHDVFEQYQNGMTVGEFCDAVGKGATGHLVWDAAHGSISIEGYTPGEPRKAKPKGAAAAAAPAPAPAAPAKPARRGKAAPVADPEDD